jgi:hypothetical protein
MNGKLVTSTAGDTTMRMLPVAAKKTPTQPIKMIRSRMARTTRTIQSPIPRRLIKKTRTSRRTPNPSRNMKSFEKSTASRRLPYSGVYRRRRILSKA